MNDKIVFDFVKNLAISCKAPLERFNYARTTTKNPLQQPSIFRDPPISKKEDIEKSVNDPVHENSRYDVKRSIRNVKGIKRLYTSKEVAKFHKACAKYLSN